MKFLALILALIVTSLSILPCTDVHSVGNNAVIAIQQTHDHSEAPADSCSPLCQCNCCQSFVIVSDLEGPYQVSAMMSVHILLYRWQIPSAISGIPWQPPKA